MPRTIETQKPATRHEASSSNEESTKGLGWGKVNARKVQADVAKDSADSIRDFWLNDGDTALIQILNEQPYCSDFFRVPVGDKWKMLQTQLVKQSYCLMSQSGLKSSWRAAFKILDLRGKWLSKEKCTEAETGLEYTEVEPQEKIWLVTNPLALALKQLIEPKKAGGTPLELTS